MCVCLYPHHGYGCSEVGYRLSKLLLKLVTKVQTDKECVYVGLHPLDGYGFDVTEGKVGGL